MANKGFKVKVELEIRSITCPGVCLCSNGKIALQIQMLDSAIQTENYKPIFPIRCREKFVFYKTFTNERRLNELQRTLNDEWIFIELVQWQNYEEGCILATFQTTLDELLYPATSRSMIMGTNMDLLMEATELFPGTISPKLDIKTKTTIEETLCESSSRSFGKILLSSQPFQNKTRKVCHSIGYSKAQKHCKEKPKAKSPVKMRPLRNYSLFNEDDDCSHGTNFTNFPEFNNIHKNCYCNRYNLHGTKKPSSTAIRRLNLCKGCNSKRSIEPCRTCSRYEGFFMNQENGQDKMNSLSRQSHCCSHSHREQDILFKKREFCPESDLESSCCRNTYCLDSAERNVQDLAKKLHSKVSRAIHNANHLRASCINCED